MFKKALIVSCMILPIAACGADPAAADPEKSVLVNSDEPTQVLPASLPQPEPQPEPIAQPQVTPTQGVQVQTPGVQVSVVPFRWRRAQRVAMVDKGETAQVIEMVPTIKEVPVLTPVPIVPVCCPRPVKCGLGIFRPKCCKCCGCIKPPLFKCGLKCKRCCKPRCYVLKKPVCCSEVKAEEVGDDLKKMAYKEKRGHNHGKRYGHEYTRNGPKHRKNVNVRVGRGYGYGRPYYGYRRATAATYGFGVNVRAGRVVVGVGPTYPPVLLPGYPDGYNIYLGY